MRKGLTSLLALVIVATVWPMSTLAEPTAVQSGAASISGRIVDASSGRPVPRAQVTAFSLTPTGRQARAVEARTDADGRYVIRALVPGAYHVAAARAGYLYRQFGQTGASRLGRRVVVGTGAAVERIDIALLRGGVITGQVTDDTGEPLPGVSVQALAALPGRRTHALFQQTPTDDRGRFRMHGLPPGEYLVAANPQHGRRMGNVVRQDRPDQELVLTFAPGTSQAADAQRIMLTDGDEVTVNIPLVTGRLATVEGRIVDSKGRPVTQTSVRLVPDEADVIADTRSHFVDDVGVFVADALPPGPYTLVVRAPLRDTSGAPDGRRGTLPDDLDNEVAVVPLVVPEEGLEGLQVTTSPPASVTGRLVVEGDTAALRGLRLLVTGWTRDAGRVPGFVGMGEVDPDLGIRVRGLVGHQVLRVSGLPAGWWVKDVRVHGQDALRGYDFGVGRELTGLEVTVSDRPVHLSGRVTSADGTPADAVVLAIPDDFERVDGPLVHGGGGLTRTGEDGSFTVAGVRPGRYHVVALDAAGVDPATLEDPQVLRDLARSTPIVMIIEGAPTFLALRPSHVR